MSTAGSSTDVPGVVAEARRAVADLRSLFRFRAAGLRGRTRRAAPLALGSIALITLAVSVLPAFLPQ